LFLDIVGVLERLGNVEILIDLRLLTDFNNHCKVLTAFSDEVSRTVRTEPPDLPTSSSTLIL
jgi:hypothetical protein